MNTAPAALWFHLSTNAYYVVLYKFSILDSLQLSFVSVDLMLGWLRGSPLEMEHLILIRELNIVSLKALKHGRKKNK